MRKFKKILLCMMMCVAIPLDAQPGMVNWDTGDGLARFAVVSTLALGGTASGIDFLAKKYYKKKIRDEDVWRLTIIGYGAACFSSWAYGYDFLAPFMFLESLAFNSVKYPFLAAKYLLSSTASLSREVGNSIATCNSHFLWGGTALVLGTGLWYYRSQYLKTEKDRKEMGELKQILEKQTTTIDVLAGQLTGANAKLESQMQPGMPLPSAPPSYLLRSSFLAPRLPDRVG